MLLTAGYSPARASSSSIVLPTPTAVCNWSTCAFTSTCTLPSPTAPGDVEGASGSAAPDLLILEPVVTYQMALTMSLPRRG